MCLSLLLVCFSNKILYEHLIYVVAFIISFLLDSAYDLATQCESRRASLRRHTIVGCQSNFDETHSMPPSRPDSRQSDISSSTAGVDGVIVPAVKKPQVYGKKTFFFFHQKISLIPKKNFI